MEKEAALSRELADLAWALMKVIKGEFKAAASPGAPTLTQYRMLHFVRKGNGRVGRLAEEFGISQPAASIMVDAMVQEGLLTRTPHPADRRQIELRLTAKASSRIEAIRGRALAKIDARLSSLPASGRRDLARRIRDVTRLLSESEAA